MKTETCIARTTWPRTMTCRLTTASATKLLPPLLLLGLVVAQAQPSYATNSGTITIKHGTIAYEEYTRPSDHDLKELLRLRKKADKGDAQSQCELGYVFYYGRLGMSTNYWEASYWFSKAASPHSPTCLVQIIQESTEQRHATPRMQTVVLRVFFTLAPPN